MMKKYKKADFPELESIKNFTYYKCYIYLILIKNLKRSRKIIPKVLRFIKAKIKK